MADDDDQNGRTGSGVPRRRRGEARPPVTLDLAASAVNPPSAGPEEMPADPVGAASDPSPGSVPPDEPGPADMPPPPRDEPRASAAAAQPARATGPSMLLLLGVAIVGGIVATILGIVLHASGLAPSPTREAANAAIAGSTALGARVGALEARLSSDLQPVIDRLGALERQAAELRTQLAQLTSRQASERTAATERLDGIAARLALVESTPGSGGGMSAEERRGLDERITTLGREVDGLRGRLAALDSGRGASRSAALASLMNAAERGEKLAPLLGLLASLGVDGEALRPLAPYADATVPTKISIVADFPRAEAAILAADARAEEARGFLDRLQDAASRLVTVRPTGPLAGGDSAAIASRMRAAVTAGDLAAALKERAGLSDAAKAASASWAESARQRDELDRRVAALAASLAAPMRAQPG